MHQLMDHPAVADLRLLVMVAVRSALVSSASRPLLRSPSTLPDSGLGPAWEEGDPMKVMARVVWDSVVEEVDRRVVKGSNREDGEWESGLVEELVRHHTLAYVVAYLRK